jgi:lysophospholipid acyltransferase (LPLAT)-like uncharacterized protein
MRRRALGWLIERLGPLTLRAWFTTIRLRWYGGKHTHPDPRTRASAIYVLWHQRLLCFAYTHARFGGRLLVSQSGDGEILARLAASLGFSPIRGSSRRGGSTAMRALLAEAGSGYDFGITPDGPRGPRQVFKEGAVYLASRSGLPVVPITVTYRRYWQCRGWDRLQLPWPFTRGVIHVGAPVSVPPALDDAGIEAWRLRLEGTLRSLTQTTDEHAEELYGRGRPRRAL